MKSLPSSMQPASCHRLKSLLTNCVQTHHQLLLPSRLKLIYASSYVLPAAPQSAVLQQSAAITPTCMPARTHACTNTSLPGILLLSCMQSCAAGREGLYAGGYLGLFPVFKAALEEQVRSRWRRAVCNEGLAWGQVKMCSG